MTGIQEKMIDSYTDPQNKYSGLALITCSMCKVTYFMTIKEIYQSDPPKIYVMQKFLRYQDCTKYFGVEV